jgi:hypothetical protein
VNFVTARCNTTAGTDRLESMLKDLDRQLGRLYHEMEEYNADFGALEELQTAASLFTDEERDELQPLLGLYGLETVKRIPPDKLTKTHAAARQQYWLDVRLRGSDPARRNVAARAETRYGLILRELA